MSGKKIWFAYDLGLIEYQETILLQKDLANARAGGIIPDVLLLLEHQPVLTHGRIVKPDEE